MEPKNPQLTAVLQGSAVTESPEIIRPNSQGSWNANSYFAPKPHSRKVEDPDSPTIVAAGFKNSADILRRLSLIDSDRPASLEADPQAAHPTLQLSGGIISASICIPHSLGLRDEKHWEIEPRRGTSALFDSFSYLSSSKSPWKHTIVGWTGEIQPLEEVVLPYSPASGTSEPQRKSLSLRRSVPVNKAAAPIPLDGSSKAILPISGDGVDVSTALREDLEQQLLHDPEGKIVPVWLFDENDEHNGTITLTDQARWRRYAEHELYTLFHYKQNEINDGRAERQRWADYCRLNEKFADKILEVYKPGDIVWIHDYHLLLLPNILRQKLPNIYIGFFLHIPFPSSEYVKCLGHRKEILTGILGSNMIGFQTYSYSRHFSSCCTRILGFDSHSASVDAYGAHIAIDVFPIGIDALEVAKSIYGDATIESKMQRIKQQYSNQKLIVGRDRLDTVRGVAQKLQAYEIFLEKYPQWRGKVVLVQVTSPTSVEEEKEDAGHKIANKISELVARINGRYGGLEYTPVYHYPQYLSKDEYFALLRAADVGLITSVRDGINTTSLEYVLCQRDNHGPLILSEFSGTAGSLTDAIHINPWDLGGVADAINQALTMSPNDKATQHRLLYKRVTANTVQHWSKNFLDRLMVNLESFNQSIATPALDRIRLLAQYQKAKRRLFMFDYDGTLTPIVKDPQAAIPSDRVIRTIKTLAQDPRNNVWIISGRDQAFLDEWMGHISELGLSAEHGSFARQPESEDWENLAEKLDMSWQKEVMNTFQHYTEKTQGSFIERKRIALTWHYRRSDPEYGAFQAQECKKHLENTVAKKWDVEIMNGKANLEVRPSFVNKGEIARRLVNEYGPGKANAPDFVLCSGDDFTDEDMFRALRATDLPADHVFSVTVGASSKQTLASWHLLEPADVIATLSLLNGTVTADNIAAGRQTANQNPRY